MNAFFGYQSIQSEKTEGLDEWERAVIDLFLNAANSFGCPSPMDKSMGFFFAGINHCRWMRSWICLKSARVQQVRVLRALRQFGAFPPSFAPGDRKERFVAEIRLRKLVSGFLREQADPHLEKGWLV